MKSTLRNARGAAVRRLGLAASAAVLALAAPGLATAQPTFPGAATATRPIVQPDFVKPAAAAPVSVGPLLPTGLYRLEIQWPANGFHTPQPAILVSQPVWLTHADPAHLPPNLLAPLQLDVIVAQMPGGSYAFSRTAQFIGAFPSAGGIALQSPSIAGVVMSLTAPATGGVANGSVVVNGGAAGGAPQHATFSLKPASEAATQPAAGQASWSVDQLFAAIQACRHLSC